MSQGLIQAGRAIGVEPAGSADAPELSRRTFLKFGVSVGAALGGGLLLGFSVPARAQAGDRGAKVGDAAPVPRAGVWAPNAFIRIDRQGAVTLIMPKVEMGQGVYTSIPFNIGVACCATRRRVR